MQKTTPRKWQSGWDWKSAASTRNGFRDDKTSQISGAGKMDPVTGVVPMDFGYDPNSGKILNPPADLWCRLPPSSPVFTGGLFALW
jgi:hypothetical protein